jgi:hypothetical protein
MPAERRLGGFTISAPTFERVRPSISDALKPYFHFSVRRFKLHYRPSAYRKAKIYFRARHRMTRIGEQPMTQHALSHIYLESGETPTLSLYS